MALAPVRRQARESRTSQPTTSRWAQLTPERLSDVLSRAERGEVRDWIDLCDRMVSIDSAIRAAYETRIAVISGARVVIEPGPPTGDEARDRHASAAADLVSRIYRGLDIATAAHELLDGIGKGFAALQIHWAWRDGIWTVDELEWVSQRRFRFVGDEIQLVDSGAEGGGPPEPLVDGLWIVHRPQTIVGVPGVVGVLRACAWPFLFKRWAQQFWVQGAESFAWPFLFAKVPRGAPDEVRQAALEGLEQISADHRAVIEDPTTLQILETTVKDGGTWRDLHNALNAEIGKAILGMSDATDAARIGAFAAVETRAGLTVDSRIAMDERALAETVRRDLNARIVRFNAHLFDGVIPPIPITRWVVQARRREIPAHLIPYVTVDEVRASLDLPPLPGGAGRRLGGLEAGQGMVPPPVTDDAAVLAAGLAGGRA